MFVGVPDWLLVAVFVDVVVSEGLPVMDADVETVVEELGVVVETGVGTGEGEGVGRGVSDDEGVGEGVLVVVGGGVGAGETDGPGPTLSVTVARDVAPKSSTAL